MINIPNESYGAEFIFAVVTTVLVFYIIQLVRIKYGDAAITHITMVPYKISMILLINLLFLTTCTLIFGETGYVTNYYKGEVNGFFEKLPYYLVLLS